MAVATERPAIHVCLSTPQSLEEIGRVHGRTLLPVGLPQTEGYLLDVARQSDKGTGYLDRDVDWRRVLHVWADDLEAGGQPRACGLDAVRLTLGGASRTVVAGSRPEKRRKGRLKAGGGCPKRATAGDLGPPITVTRRDA